MIVSNVRCGLGAFSFVFVTVGERETRKHTLKLLRSTVALLVHDERIGFLEEKNGADGRQGGDGGGGVEGEVKADLTQERADNRSDYVGDRETTF